MASAAEQMAMMTPTARTAGTPPSWGKNALHTNAVTHAQTGDATIAPLSAFAARST